MAIPGGTRPFLGVLAELIEKGVQVRLMHAKEPGPIFREDFDRYPILATGLERAMCPRVHFRFRQPDRCRNRHEKPEDTQF